MENCCMEQGDAVLSAPAWQFRMLHLAHRTATDALLDKYGLKASECVCIDDNLANVQAAFTLSFVGIRMKESVGTLVRSLATCNVALR